MVESRHALIIANDTYEDQGLKQLRAPGHDAEALSGVLRNPQIGDFEVDVLRNASTQEMKECIEGFLLSDRGRDDQLVLHFSCHGIKSESGELYFAASNTKPRLLDSTGVSADFVQRCMSRTRAGCTVLFLDCCYGGAFSRGASVRASRDMHVLDAFAGEKPSGGRGWAVITASNSMEYAFEDAELTEGSTARPSVFTHAVVEGLETGDADRDEDGEVSLDDLYEYVYDRVRDQNPNQNPSKTVQMQGTMQLAHGRRRRIRIEPEPVPRAVQDALRSRNIFTRLGAVAEVRSRMASPALSMAEGARQALEAVVRNDTQQVADEARRALDDVSLKPAPARLDFGRVPRDTAVPQQTVTLQGIPLARHCVAQPAGKWLRVEESSEGLAVGVDTSAEGRLTGDIMLKGVADDAVVRVEAEVVPPPPDKPPDTPTDSEGKGPTATHRPPSRPVRAPAMAAATLALAVISVIMLIVAADKAVRASIDLGQVGMTGEFEDSAGKFSLLPPLIVSLVTAVAALSVGALARQELRSRRRRYTQGARSATRALVSLARLCAIPVVVLGALMSIAYPIVITIW
ncbi:hypothetical protein GCM10011579_021070 [Streptomyces albiflavescens]|uniref:Caspase family p20 domain-containing protein n=1 Tax=Streptomyces albiflavescens TaxID=1623582 RepID=A0A918D1J8_9ACTN|nr:caspase family protein [Streptomyces albiflavescens]GGN58125.1 hypothetical protein GCM10011579_021070 [Streptomyces albiflavescens]